MVLYAVYNEKHYRDLVCEAAEKSMLAAVQEVKALPHYESKGEVRTFMFAKCITMFPDSEIAKSFASGHISSRYYRGPSFFNIA